jgi:hypothetical protein
MLTMSASYHGDLNFSPVTGTKDHTITGNHLVFNSDPPSDVPQGLRFSGTVEVHNAADAIVTSDNLTNVTVTVNDTCGNPNNIGPVQVVNGVASFSGLGTRFYTLANLLNIAATSDNSVATGNSTLNIVASSDMIFPNDTTNPAANAGFDDCSP